MTIDNLETRVIRRPLELRAAKGDDGGDVFTGYVFAWDTESDDLGGFREIIKRGSCTAAIAHPKNIFAILDHEKKVQNVLGDRDSGTLKLFEDDRGLGFTINAGPTQAAKDAAVVARRNNIGVSFAFICGQQQWTTKPDGTRLRTISEFKELDDLSLVVDAAYKSSDVTVAKRSLEEAIAAGSLPRVETRQNDNHDAQTGQFASGDSAGEASGKAKAASEHAAKVRDNPDSTPDQRAESHREAYKAHKAAQKEHEAKTDKDLVKQWHEGKASVTDPKVEEALKHQAAANSHKHAAKEHKALAVHWEGVAGKRTAWPDDGDEIETRAAIPFKSTPANDADTWDGAAAEKRVRAWATSGEGDKAKVDFTKYRHAFAYETGDGTKLGDFHLLYHDVKGDKLVLVWRGVTAAMAAVNGSRGGVKWEKPADRQAVYDVLAKAYKAFKQDPPELRAQPQSQKETRTVDVELLKRDFELRTLEMRMGGYPDVLGPVSDGDPPPQYPRDSYLAHAATRDAMRAKSQTGAPSRALELAAADCHDQAARSAASEGKPASAKFHQAAAEMHRAASGDDYAGEFAGGMPYYGPDCRMAADRSDVETRANPHHDADGQFHDGSPKSILQAAAGRMQKAETRNADAVNAWKEAHDSFGDEHEFTVEAAEKRAAASKSHLESIQAAEAAIPEADAAHAKMVAEHRAACTESRSKQSALEVIGSGAPESGFGTDKPSAAGEAAAAAGAPAT